MFGCEAGSVMTSGTQCFVQCSPGFTYVSGSTYYACKAGELFRQPTMKCLPAPCTVSSDSEQFIAGNFAVYQEGSALDRKDNHPACYEGLKLSSGESCVMQCADGAYKRLNTPEEDEVAMCNEGSMKVPQMDCVTTLCKLPAKIGSDVFPARSGVWQRGNMEPDRSLDPLFASPGVGGSKGGALYGYKYCEADQMLKSGQACVLRCIKGFSHKIDADKPNYAQLLYRCDNGVLYKPLNWCMPNACELPKSDGSHPMGLPYGTTYNLGSDSPTDPNNCNPDELLESGQKCDIQCYPGFYISGFGTYSYAPLLQSFCPALA